MTMTEPTANTDTHALLEKSQVVHQTSRGPTVEEVAAQLLRQALEALYPERDEVVKLGRNATDADFAEIHARWDEHHPGWREKLS